MGEKFWNLMEKMGRLADLFILNTLFVLSCLPVFTVGAALAAIYQTCFQIEAKTNSTLFRTYRTAFVKNFKQATFLWMLYLFLALDACLILWSVGGGNLFAVWSAGKAVQAAAVLFVLFYVSTIVYVFPMISYFRCSTKQCLVNAAGLAFHHLPGTLLVLLIWGASAVLIRFGPFLLMILPAAVCWLTSMIIGRIFRTHIKEEPGKIMEDSQEETV